MRSPIDAACRGAALRYRIHGAAHLARVRPRPRHLRRERPRRPILDVWYPAPALAAEPADVPAPRGRLRRGPDPRRASRAWSRTVIDDLSAPPADVADAYLRLHLLSHRLVAPRTINLDGIFGVLPNVAWTTAGPGAPSTSLTEVRLRARVAGEPLTVLGVDKFPRMVDYVVPSGVRIADADRVRLGAHLAEGTTVMHEGFCNFNAGTLGPSMVEGRISAGVVVGDGSDIGGGASIMGTLSGGGKEQVTIGEGASSAPTPASGSPWATAASSRRAATSPPARR